MAIILEGTQFEDAVSGSVNVKRLVYETRHPNSILINILGKNSGFSGGEKVTYVNGSTKFTGTIWHIYQGATSFNLYIKHPSPAALAGKLGGTVSSGRVAVVSSAPEFESASTLLKTAQATETLNTPSGTTTGPAVTTDSGAPAKAGIMAKLPPFMQNPKMLAGAGIALAAVVLLVMKKKKGK